MKLSKMMMKIKIWHYSKMIEEAQRDLGKQIQRLYEHAKRNIREADEIKSYLKQIEDHASAKLKECESVMLTASPTR